jgi:hypothetical protein
MQQKKIFFACCKNKIFFLLRSLGTRRANLYSIDYQHDLFMPIKEPLDANSRKTM